MSRLDRYLFRQLFWTGILVLASLTCVVWLIQSLRFVEMIVNRGLSVPVFVWFTALLLPSFISIILPIAMLIAVLFTYNRLMVDSELVVMRASGLSPRRLARPAITLALLAVALGYALTLYILPASYHAFKETQAEIRNTYTSVLLQEGVFNTLMPDVTVYVRDRRASGELEGIIVHDARDKEHTVTMMAERGAMTEGPNGPRVLMLNGNRQELTRSTGKMSLLYFDRYIFDVGAFSASSEERWREPRERFLNELLLPPSMAATTFNYNKLVMEGHSRLSSPLLILASALIALACLLTGEFNRRGQLQRVVAACILVIGMQALWLVVKSLGEKYLAVAPLLYADAIIPIVVAAAILALDNRLRRPRRVAAPAAA
jgi:lipopolysaccharide export system permease protein